MKKRYFTLDFLRGLAILGMVLYHYLLYIYFTREVTYDPFGGYLKVFQVSIAATFITVSSIVFYIGYVSYSVDKRFEYLIKIIKKSTKLFILGTFLGISMLLITGYSIDFGILHFLAIATLLNFIFIKFNKLNIFLAVLFFVVGIYYKDLYIENYFFFFLVSSPNYYFALDYFTLLPWYGFALIGLFIGEFYLKYSARINIFQNKYTNLIAFLGKNSLLIYILHMPLIYLFNLIALRIFG